LDFLIFAAHYGFSVLPASSQAIALFFAHLDRLGQGGGVRSAVMFFHTKAGLPNPCVVPTVKLVIDGMDPYEATECGPFVNQLPGMENI